MSDIGSPTGNGGENIGNLVRDARELCAKNWWVYLVGGIAAIIFAILAFTKPGAAALVLGMFFAAFILADGIFSLFGAIANRGHDGWWLGLLYGALAIIIGGYLLVTPLAASLALIYTVAFVIIFFGVTQIMLGVRVRKAVTGEWVLYVAGGLSVLFGAFILANTLVGAVTVVYLIATWALLVGALRVVFALKARKFGKSGLA